MKKMLCMVLCVTMFFGTSYAWFTSEVNNEGNESEFPALRDSDSCHSFKQMME